MWKYHSLKSIAEHGTLYQLRNCLHRKNVVSIQIQNFDASEDFFILIVESIAAMHAWNEGNERHSFYSVCA